MKKLVKVVASAAVALSFVGVSGQVASAAVETVKPGISEDVPTTPTIKKGDVVFVIIKDTKKQKVAVYNKNGKKTRKTVKMGSEFKVQAVKKTHGKKIVKVAGNKRLNTKDITKE